MEEVAYQEIQSKLKISIENLYPQSREVLAQIEEGMKFPIKENPIVGYQGVAGAFGEQAAYAYFNGSWEELRSHETFEEVFAALEAGEIDYGIVPIENSSAGEVLDIYDLIKAHQLYIVGEQTIKIEHNLLGVRGSSIEALEEVYSHPQGLSQSKVFLKEHGHIAPIAYVNTAAACQFVARTNDLTKAAIGSKRAAQLYDLEVLAESIQFNKHNSTRFIVIARNLHITSSCNKISIVFSTAHKSGSLYNILGHFAYNGLNLLKIQSRPLVDKKWEYYFFVDIEGNLQEATVLIALSRVSESCEYFKILGNYKQSE